MSKENDLLKYCNAMIETITTDKCELSYSLIHSTEIYIESVHVDYRHRRQGVARAEIKKLLESYPLVDTVTLDATVSSKRKWKQMGFTFKKDRGIINAQKLKQ